jgi:hypothetical protein
MGVPDSVLKSIAGHITQRMLDDYSHVRLTAKRQALDGLDAYRADEALPALGQSDAQTVQCAFDRVSLHKHFTTELDAVVECL